jgi:hypothetical protein
VHSFRGSERSHLKRLLQKYELLFDGTLRTWDIEPIDLELMDPNAKPCHAKPYLVPQAQEAKLKAEIERLASYGVLQKVNCSEWASQMLTVTTSQIYCRFENSEQKDPPSCIQSQRSRNYYTNSKGLKM